MFIGIRYNWFTSFTSSDNSSTCPLSLICLVESNLECGKSGRLSPEINSMACWKSRVSNSLSGRFLEKTAIDSLTIGLTLGKFRALSLGEISVNSVMSGILQEDSKY